MWFWGLPVISCFCVGFSTEFAVDFEPMWLWWDCPELVAEYGRTCWFLAPLCVLLIWWPLWGVSFEVLLSCGLLGLLSAVVSASVELSTRTPVDNDVMMLGICVAEYDADSERIAWMFAL